jgi:hypothetical protein
MLVKIVKIDKIEVDDLQRLAADWLGSTATSVHVTIATKGIVMKMILRAAVCGLFAGATLLANAETAEAASLPCVQRVVSWLAAGNNNLARASVSIMTAPTTTGGFNWSYFGRTYLALGPQVLAGTQGYPSLKSDTTFHLAADNGAINPAIFQFSSGLWTINWIPTNNDAPAKFTDNNNLAQTWAGTCIGNVLYGTGALNQLYAVSFALESNPN